MTESKKRIAFHNTYEPVTSLYRDLCPALAEDGHDVYVVVSRAQYRAREFDLTSALEQFGVTTRSVGPGRGAVVSGRLGKTVAMVSYAVFGAIDAVLRPKDIRFFLTQPPFFAVIGRLLRRVRGERYVCICMDLYPDVLVANGLIAKNGVIDRGLSALSKFILTGADAVVSIGRDMSRHLELIGVDPERIHYVPNWSSGDNIMPITPEHNSLRRELGFEDKDFIVLYSGNLGVSHYFDDILEVALRERDRGQLKFVFVGGGPRIAEVEHFREKHALANVHLIPYQPVSRLAESLSMGDIHFISLRTGFGGLVVPSKVFGAMAVGRPIVFQGDEQDEVSTMLEQHQIGSHVSQGDSQALQALVLEYMTNADRRHDEGARSCSAYNDNYSATVGIERYRAVVRQVIGQ